MASVRIAAIGAMVLTDLVVIGFVLAVPWPSAGVAHGQEQDGARSELLSVSDEVGITMQADALLEPGERGTITVTVVGARALSAPVLLTVTMDGTAAELLQGRLLRAQGRSNEETGSMTFQVPILGRSPGAVVLAAELRSFACAARCRAVTTVAQTRVQIRSR